jgi:carbamoyl-phosphate synthase large subunit
MMMGYTLEQIHCLTKIDYWFLEKLRHILTINDQLKEFTWLSEYYSFAERTEFLETLEDPRVVNLLLEAKKYGFSDFQIARALGLEADMNMEKAGLVVRKWRQELGIMPVVNQIDTLAAEYPAQTNYLYLTYL